MAGNIDIIYILDRQCNFPAEAIGTDFLQCGWVGAHLSWIWSRWARISWAWVRWKWKTYLSRAVFQAKSEAKGTVSRICKSVSSFVRETVLREGIKYWAIHASFQWRMQTTKRCDQFLDPFLFQRGIRQGHAWLWPYQGITGQMRGQICLWKVMLFFVSNQNPTEVANPDWSLVKGRATFAAAILLEPQTSAHT